MRKKRTSAAALTAAFLCACAAGGRTAPLEGPSPQSDDPVIGRPFRVELPRGGERTLRLEGVRGRITLVCVLGESAERVADACAGVRERWRDRVAMVGIWVGEPGDLTGLPFRAYVDPGGESLRRELQIDPRSQVLVLDVRGRLVRRLGLDELDALQDDIARRLP